MAPTNHIRFDFQLVPSDKTTATREFVGQAWRPCTHARLGDLATEIFPIHHHSPYPEQLSKLLRLSPRLAVILVAQYDLQVETGLLSPTSEALYQAMSTPRRALRAQIPKNEQPLRGGIGSSVLRTSWVEEKITSLNSKSITKSPRLDNYVCDMRLLRPCPGAFIQKDMLYTVVRLPTPEGRPIKLPIPLDHVRWYRSIDFQYQPTDSVHPIHTGAAKLCALLLKSWEERLRSPYSLEELKGIMRSPVTTQYSYAAAMLHTEINKYIELPQPKGPRQDPGEFRLGYSLPLWESLNNIQTSIYPSWQIRMLYPEDEEWTIHKYDPRRSSPQVRRKILSRLRYVLTTLRREDGEFPTAWEEDRDEVLLGGELERIHMEENKDGDDICAWCFRIYPCHELFLSADYKLTNAADNLSTCETCLMRYCEDSTARERAEMWIRLQLSRQFRTDERRVYGKVSQGNSLQSVAKEEAERLVDACWTKNEEGTQVMRCMYTRQELEVPWSRARAYGYNRNYHPYGPSIDAILPAVWGETRGEDRIYHTRNNLALVSRSANAAKQYHPPGALVMFAYPKKNVEDRARLLQFGSNLAFLENVFLPGHAYNNLHTRTKFIESMIGSSTEPEEYCDIMRQAFTTGMTPQVQGVVDTRSPLFICTARMSLGNVALHLKNVRSPDEFCLTCLEDGLPCTPCIASEKNTTAKPDMDVLRRIAEDEGVIQERDHYRYWRHKGKTTDSDTYSFTGDSHAARRHPYFELMHSPAVLSLLLKERLSRLRRSCNKRWNGEDDENMTPEILLYCIHRSRMRRLKKRLNELNEGVKDPGDTLIVDDLGLPPVMDVRNLFSLSICRRDHSRGFHTGYPAHRIGAADFDYVEDYDDDLCNIELDTWATNNSVRNMPAEEWGGVMRQYDDINVFGDNMPFWYWGESMFDDDYTAKHLRRWRKDLDTEQKRRILWEEVQVFKKLSEAEADRRRDANTPDDDETLYGGDDKALDPDESSFSGADDRALDGGEVPEGGPGFFGDPLEVQLAGLHPSPRETERPEARSSTEGPGPAGPNPGQPEFYYHSFKMGYIKVNGRAKQVQKPRNGDEVMLRCLDASEVVKQFKNTWPYGAEVLAVVVERPGDHRIVGVVQTLARGGGRRQDMEMMRKLVDRRAVVEMDDAEETGKPGHWILPGGKDEYHTCTGSLIFVS